MYLMKWHTMNLYNKRTFVKLALAAVAATSTLASFTAAAETPPQVIRIGAPTYAGQGGKQVLLGTIGIARAKGFFDEEFAKDGVKLDFPGFKGGAPFVGQALANGQIDFAWQGDLLTIVGKSSGMKTRLILPFNKLVNAYVAVAANSPINTIEELRDKRVAYNKGNQIHLQALRILGDHGLTEKDIKSYKLDPGNAPTVLSTGDIDAIFIASEALSLRDKGIAKILYSTRDDKTEKSLTYTSYNGLIANEDFAKKYPETTARLVKVLVKAAWWASEPANRDEVLKIWGEGPLPSKYIAEDYSSRPWTDRLSPLFDPLLVAHYKRTQDQIEELGLLRGPKFDVDQWIDRSYLNAALKSLKLEKYWPELDEKGNPIKR
jgi:sulfonate transport system substrate-binding protein